MLWWFVGVWLASGLVIPVLWLTSMAGRAVSARDSDVEPMPAVVAQRSVASVMATVRRWLASALTAGRPFRRSGHRRDARSVTPTVSRMGQYVLSGLITFAALFLLFISSFSDSSAPTRDLSTRLVVDQAPAALATAATTTHEPAAVTEAERAASLQPQDGRFANSADEDASGRTIAVAPPEPVSEALLTVPAYPRAPAERGVAHRRAQGPQVPTYVTRSSRGTWLFPPTVNAGGNS
jgi:hypothetical protein